MALRAPVSGQGNVLHEVNLQVGDACSLPVVDDLRPVAHHLFLKFKMTQTLSQLSASRQTSRSHLVKQKFDDI